MSISARIKCTQLAVECNQRCRRKTSLEQSCLFLQSYSWRFGVLSQDRMPQHTQTLEKICLDRRAALQIAHVRAPELPRRLQRASELALQDADCHLVLLRLVSLASVDLTRFNSGRLKCMRMQASSAQQAHRKQTRRPRTPQCYTCSASGSNILASRPCYCALCLERYR